MSQGGSYYSRVEDLSGRGHRRGVSERCGAVCVLIRLILRSSVWRFPSTLTLSLLSLLTWALLDIKLPIRLSSIRCWHRQAAPSVTRLINSCRYVPAATAVHALAFMRTCVHPLRQSFPICRQWSVCQCAHFDMFWHFVACLNHNSCTIHCYPLIRSIDSAVRWQDKCIHSFLAVWIRAY